MSTTPFPEKYIAASGFSLDMTDPLCRFLLCGQNNRLPKAVKDFFPKHLLAPVARMQSLYGIYASLAKAKGPKTGHQRLAITAAKLEFDDAFKDLNMALAPLFAHLPFPEKWKLSFVAKGPSIHIQAPRKLQLKSATSYSSNPWCLIGHLHTMAWIVQKNHISDGQWTDLVRGLPLSTQDIPSFVIKPTTKSTPFQTLLGPTPKTAHIAGLTAQSKLPTPHHDNTPQQAFITGARKAIHQALEPIAWFGGHNLWPAIFATDAARILCNGSITPRKNAPWYLLMGNPPRSQSMQEHFQDSNKHLRAIALLSRNCDMATDPRAKRLRLGDLAPSLAPHIPCARNLANPDHTIGDEPRHWNAQSLVLQHALLSMANGNPVDWISDCPIYTQTGRVPDILPNS